MGVILLLTLMEDWFAVGNRPLESLARRSRMNLLTNALKTGEQLRPTTLAAADVISQKARCERIPLLAL